MDCGTTVARSVDEKERKNRGEREEERVKSMAYRRKHILSIGGILEKGKGKNRDEQKDQAKIGREDICESSIIYHFPEVEGTISKRSFYP